MANFITSSLTYAGKETMEKVFKPLFIGQDIFATKGVRVKMDVVSKQKLNYVGRASKISKAYQKGFNPATGAAVTSRDIDVTQMKAEMAQDANEFWETVFEAAQGKGVDWNDISKGGSEIRDIVLTVFNDGLRADFFRHFWMNDPNKETLDVNGNYSGTPDTDYNAFEGMWYRLFAKASTTPNYDNGDIKRVVINSSAVAQVEAVTVTGTGGTANINVNGVNYLATFDTDLTTTAANFVTTHAAALLLRGIIVTSAVAVISFTSAIAGQPFAAPTIANVSGDLAGSVAQTTANTASSALGADATLATLDTLHTNCARVLKALPAKQKVILMDSLSYDNYEQTLRSFNSTSKFSLESGKTLLTNGQEVLTYKGIPVLNMDWDEYTLIDFPHATGELSGFPYRIILTEASNLVAAIDAKSEFTRFNFWYNMDEQENRYRLQYKMGTNYTHNEMVAVAY